MTIILIQPLEALVAITAILVSFGLGGYIVLKIIQLIRDSIMTKRAPLKVPELMKRIEEHEQRQEQLIKRVQNLETIIVDADLGNPQLRAHQQDTESGNPSSGPDASHPLKNKLRS